LVRGPNHFNKVISTTLGGTHEKSLQNFIGEVRDQKAHSVLYWTNIHSFIHFTDIYGISYVSGAVLGINC
jgi:hypothetical protein